MKKLLLTIAFFSLCFISIAQLDSSINKDHKKLDALKRKCEDLPLALNANLNAVYAILKDMKLSSIERDSVNKLVDFVKNQLSPVISNVEIVKKNLNEFEKRGEIDYINYKKQEKLLRTIKRDGKKAVREIYKYVDNYNSPLITNMIDKYIQQLSDEKEKLKEEESNFKYEKERLKKEKEDIESNNNNLVKNIEKIKGDYEIYKEKEKSMSHKIEKDSIALTIKIDSISAILTEQVINLSRQKLYSELKYQQMKMDASKLKSSTDSLKNKSDSLSYGIIQKTNELSDTIVRLKDKSEQVRNMSQILLSKDEQSEIQNQKIILGIATILLTLLVLFIQYQRYRNTKKGKLKVQKVNEKLEKANKQLEEKGVHLVALMRELHHRTKNNLQTISSLFYLQAEEISDTNLKDVLIEARSRVDTLGIIHKQLYQNQGQDLTKINLPDYVKELIKHLLDVNKHPSNKIQVHFDVQELNIELDDAIKVGLLLNELVQNSFKHAFPYTKQPNLSIQMNKIFGNLKIVVKDNGPGFPKGMTFVNVQSFGLKLVQLLVEGNDGALRYANKEGAFFEITMPIFNQLKQNEHVKAKNFNS